MIGIDVKQNRIRLGIARRNFWTKAIFVWVYFVQMTLERDGRRNEGAVSAEFLDSFFVPKCVFPFFFVIFCRSTAFFPGSLLDFVLTT